MEDDILILHTDPNVVGWSISTPFAPAFGELRSQAHAIPISRGENARGGWHLF